MKKNLYFAKKILLIFILIGTGIFTGIIFDSPSFAEIVDETAPTIINIDPVNGGTGVSINKFITVQFSENVYPGGGLNNIKLQSADGTVPVTISVSGSTLTIRPTTQLAYDTLYSVSIPVVAVQDSQKNAPVEGLNFTFKTLRDSNPPTVRSSDPVRNTIGVPFNKTITISFSEDITQGTNFNSITLQKGTETLPVDCVINGKILTIDPQSDLENNSVYTLSVPTGAIRDLYNNDLAYSYSYNFTTLDTEPPKVTATSPANNETGVTLSRGMIIKFTENMSPGPSFGNITLKTGTTTVAATVRISGGTLTIRPLSQMTYDTTYTVTLPAGSVQDIQRNNLTENICFSFKTVADTFPPVVRVSDPVRNSIGVTLDKEITIVFSESVSQGTNFDSITLRKGTEAAPLTCTVNGDVLTIKPLTGLHANSVYTLTIPSTAIKDPFNNSLPSPYIINFATIDTEPPMLIVTSPLNEETGVSLTKSAVIRFNEKLLRGPNFGKITLNSGSTSVPVLVNLTGNRLVILPVTKMTFDTKYTVSVPAGAVQDAQGNIFSNDVGFSFRTLSDTISPTIRSSDPVRKKTGVSLDKALIITFSENVVRGMGFGGITLKKGAAEVPITCELNGSVLSINPQNGLEANSVYTLTVPPGAVKDTFNNDLVYTYELTFTTIDTEVPRVILTAPVCEETKVSPLRPCVLKFNESVLQGPYFNNIELRKGATEVPAIINVSGSTLTIRPASGLDYNTTYTLTAPAGAVQDFQKNANTESIQLCFTTISDTFAPRLFTTDPVNSSSGITLDKTITVTFTENVLPGAYINYVTVKDGNTDVPVICSISDNKLTIDPKESLEYGKVYTVTIPAGTVKDQAGNCLTYGYNFYFTTVER